MNNINFYETNYGESRVVLFEIFAKFLSENNDQKISVIFQEVLEKMAKDKDLLLDDFMKEIDDDFLSQTMIGIVDNIDEINEIINEFKLNKYPYNFQIILRLIIFELKFLAENSVQNIFDEYQKICKIKDIKFDKNIVLELMKKIREFEF